MSETTLKTVNKLFTLSKNRCAFLNCISLIIDGFGLVTGRFRFLSSSHPAVKSADA